MWIILSSFIDFHAHQIGKRLRKFPWKKATENIEWCLCKQSNNISAELTPLPLTQALCQPGFEIKQLELGTSGKNLTKIF